MDKSELVEKYEENHSQEEKNIRFENKSLLEHLPTSFTNFLQENEIDLQYFSRLEDFPRYVRIKREAHVSIDDLRRDLGTEEVEKVNYLDDFYAIPSHVKIVNSKYYQSGQLYGMDLSSGAVIKALNPQIGDKVLDLCCCPGMKLCFIADLIGPLGIAVGVDINETRLSTCKNIVKKYALDKVVRLELADGTTFDNEQEFDRVLVDAECTHDGSLKHLAKFINSHVNLISNTPSQIPKINTPNQKDELSLHSNHSPSQDAISKEGISDIIINNNANDIKHYKTEFDETLDSTKEYALKKDTKAIVDSEGLSKITVKKVSNRELKRRQKQLDKNNSNIYCQKKIKKNEWSMDDFEARVLDPIKLSNIVDLQKRLLENGFRLCKKGGSIVYSTCSFAKNQNEDVVEWFLQTYPGQIEQIHPFPNGNEQIPYKPGKIPNTIRFDPFVSKSGGMFVSKFIKM